MKFTTLAKSHTQPRSLAGYQKHLSRSNGRTGMMEMKIVAQGQAFLGVEWVRKFLVLKHGILYVFATTEDRSELSFNNINLDYAEVSISLEDVNKLQQKTIGGPDDIIICLKTYEVAYFLKAETKVCSLSHSYVLCSLE